MDVTHDTDHSRFVIAADGHEAELVYKRVDDHLLDLLHTHVPPELAHRGLGDALARAALDYAHANDDRVILTCPFLRHWILSHPDDRAIVIASSADAHR